ncbi:MULTISPECIES: restriction endonuclease subunit S [Streptomyces]|uniref:restriction endonuclease subunit S n=1 Tax=Streptomyces TaxID=1883 RepID=UPI00200CA86D|nr:restriction endonuclease subunit S [Streptomyces sp. LRE541]UPZ29186.1 restriction endonuclease subunit S [Streptomyces sp. LRE541]
MAMQDSIIGEIPADWKCATIGSAYEIYNQNRLPISRERRRDKSGQYPYYGPTGVLDYINEYRFDGTFALIGEDGDNFLKFATHPMTLLASGRFNVNNHAHVIGSDGVNLVEWFQQYFEHRDITTHLTRQGASRYKLTKAALLDLPLALPGQPEQQAIVNALSDISGLLKSLDRALAKKQAIKQGLMRELLEGRVRLPGFSEKWSDKKISELATVNPESLASGTNPRRKVDYISLEDVRRGDIFGATQMEFKDAPSRARRVIRSHDILFGTVRPNLQSHALYRGNWKHPIASTGFAIVRTGSSSDPGFLFQLLMSHLADVQISRIIAGSNYPAVSSADVCGLTFMVPSLEEQQAIGAVLSDFDKELSLLKRRSVKAVAMKQGMMQALLSGRTRLPVQGEGGE